jgi:flavin reductase (DIM6/NTAB) family NADH-FMN oxidoreductase RutF
MARMEDNIAFDTDAVRGLGPESALKLARRGAKPELSTRHPSRDLQGVVSPVESSFMKELPAAHAYRLLEPGPIVLVTTSLNKKPNVMTMGFHMMIQHGPPLIGCVIGPWDHSYTVLRATGECVIAIPTVDLAEAVIDIGNRSGDTINKFERFGLTPAPASNVRPPLIRECLANIECTIADDRLVDEYNLFILKAERLWIDADRQERRTMHHRGDGSFTVDGDVLDLCSRMTKWRHLP